MDLDDWYEIVQEAVGPPRHARRRRRAALLALGASAAVVGLVVVVSGDGDGDQQAATDNLETSDSFTSSSARRTTTTRPETSTSTTAAPTPTTAPSTTTPAAPVALVTTTTTAATTTTATTAAPPPPEPAPPWPRHAQSGGLSVQTGVGPRSDPAIGQTVTFSIDYADNSGNLDFVSLELGDGRRVSRDYTPACAQGKTRHAGPESGSVRAAGFPSLSHSYGAAGRYAVRVTVMTNDCVPGDLDTAVATGDILVRG